MIGEDIAGDMDAFELKLIDDMDAMPPSEWDVSMYTHHPGVRMEQVRASRIVDNADVSSLYGRKVINRVFTV